MQQLVELSKVVSSLENDKGKESLAVNKGAKSKADQFYELLVTQKIKTDKQAAAHFYGEEADGSLPKYQQLKSRVKQKLLKNLLASKGDDISFRRLEDASTNCWRAWSAVQVLRKHHAYRAAMDLAERVLKYAMKYEFTGLAAAAAKLLRMFSTQYADTKKWAYYNKLANQYIGAQIAESKIDEYNQSLRLQFKSSDKVESELATVAWAYYQSLEPYLTQYDTNRIQRFGRFIKVMAQLMEHDYKGALETCEEAISYFRAKPYFSKAAFLSFFFQQLLCYINLKDYDKGIVAADKGIKYVQKGTFNWFKVHEMRFLLAMHSERYQDAYEIYRSVSKHKSLQRLPQLEQESWKLYEAYVYLLVYTEKAMLLPDDKKLTKFRLGRFLNEVPQYSKSKRGKNIPILVIQLLLLIVQRRYSDAIDRIEAIEKYVGRYLKSSGNYRSNCFIKMVLQIPISGFHKNAVVRRAKPHHKRLKSTSINVANRAHEIEIIPYENLWEIILHALDKKFYWSRKHPMYKKKFR